MDAREFPHTPDDREYPYYDREYPANIAALHLRLMLDDAALTNLTATDAALTMLAIDDAAVTALVVSEAGSGL